VHEQILGYLSRRAGTPENLARSLGVASDQLDEALDEMEAKGRDELIAELKRDLDGPTSESPKSRRCATNGSTFGLPYADGPGCRMTVMPTSLDNGQRSPRKLLRKGGRTRNRRQ
jgi:hypothetical protein